MSDVKLTDDLLAILKEQREVQSSINDCKTALKLLEDRRRHLDSLFEKSLAEEVGIPPIGSDVRLNGHYPEKITHVWYEKSTDDIRIMLSSYPSLIGHLDVTHRSIPLSEFKTEVQE